MEVSTPSGLRYVDLRKGGGETAPGPEAPLLMAHLTVTMGDESLVLFDTKKQNRPLTFFYGAQPLTGALCPGLEEGISTMRVGGIRKISIPSALAFPEGKRFPGGTAPPGTSLTYLVELLRVSPPPS